MGNDLREAVGTDSRGRAYAAERSKRRPRKEGHDELIARLTPVGTTAWVYMQSGDIIKGELRGSDRFTITVGDAAAYDKENNILEELTSEDSPVFIIYKHAIEGFKLRINGDKADNRG